MPPIQRTPQHERRERTRAALLRAAGRVFAEQGFHRATLAAVAAAAGVSKGALYHYFPSKEQLFLALLEDRLGAGIGNIEAVVAERGFASRDLGAATETFLQRMNRDPRWLPLLLEFLAHGTRDAAAKAGIIEHFLRPAREAVARTNRRLGIPEIEGALLSPGELGLVLAALVNGLAIERAFDPGAVPKDLLPRLFVVLQAGLSATADPAGASKRGTKPTTAHEGGRAT
jgi:AcrR family transcriptional regulator